MRYFLNFYIFGTFYAINNDDELYFEKAKQLNKEFYDNLDIKFYRIEEFLNKLENQ